MNTQRIKNGLLVEVNLGDGSCTFARVLSKAELAFYDFRRDLKSEVDIEEIYRSPILFIVSVMNDAIKSGRWKIHDCRPLEPSFERVRYYFMKDLITGEYSIYNANDGSIRPAKPGEEVGLEKAAVWEPENVEERLRDHYAGRENRWVKQLME